MKKLTLITVILMAAILLSAQLLNGQITFEKMYNYEGPHSMIIDIEQTSDSGYFAINFIDPGIGFGSTLYRINKFGDTLWTRGSSPVLNNICLSNDGGVIGVGYDFSFLGDESIINKDESIIKKYDEFGDIIWQSENYHWPTNILQCSDNNYIFDSNYSFGGGNSGINKINDDCDSIWSHSLAVRGGITDIIQTSNNGFAITVNNSSFSADTSWLIITDSLGIISWSMPYDSILLNALCYTEDNGFLLVGYDGNSMESNVIAIKTDSLGNIIWQKSYDFGETSRANSICKTNDQDFVIAISNSYLNPLSETLVKIDNSGDIIWTREYGDGLFDLKITNDNGLIAGGIKDGESYLVKTDYDGLISSIFETRDESQIILDINPNPTNGLLKIEFKLQKREKAYLKILSSTGQFINQISVEISIHNITGNCLKRWQFHNEQTGQVEFILDLKDLPAGIYFCRVQVGNEMVTKKIIKTK